jgi:hypothetical protein
LGRVLLRPEVPPRRLRGRRFKGIAKWMYADDVAAMYKDKSDEIDRTVADGSMGAIDESFTDRPQGQSWVDRRNRRLMVVELYEKEGGEWTRCVYHSGGWLEYGPSPYLDHKGRPTCPIEAQSAYVTRNNDRYGAVRDMRGPQDEVNKRRSKSLHMLSTRQLEETQPGAATINPDLARAEAARPDGIIPAGYRISPNNDVVSGHMALLQEAKAEIERLGPNPAILGREGADSSGRALLARQQSGLVELAILFGALEDWELRIYRQMWARARQFWTDPMWIRVTDDEGAPKFVQLNEPQMGPGQVVQRSRDGYAGDPASGARLQEPSRRDGRGYHHRRHARHGQPPTGAVPGPGADRRIKPAYAQQVPFEMLLEMSSHPAQAPDAGQAEDLPRAIPTGPGRGAAATAADRHSGRSGQDREHRGQHPAYPRQGHPDRRPGSKGHGCAGHAAGAGGYRVRSIAGLRAASISERPIGPTGRPPPGLTGAAVA